MTDPAQSRAVPRLAGAGAIGLLAAVSSLTFADPDLWGHVRFGLDFLHSRRLPSLDPYSFTQDRSWVNHEWLSETFMAAAYSLGGSPGLALLKGALVSLAVWLVWRSLRGTEFAVRAMSLALFVIGTGRITKTLRPQLFSLVCFLLLCRALNSERVAARRWLPLVFALWANLHGGWLVGLGVLTVWASVEAWRRPARRRDLIVITGLSAIATWATPYGWGLWAFMRETVGLGRAITEWQPLWTTPPAAWAPWIISLILVVWFSLRPDPHRFSRAAVLAMLGYVSLRVERVVPFFCAGTVALFAPLIQERWSRSKQALKAAVPAAAGACALALVASFWVGRSSGWCIRMEGSWLPDRSAARLLDSAAGGRLVTYFDWGQYAIWHWGPRLRVSMDGRRETVYSDARLAEHDAIVAGRAEGMAILEQWRPEYVWLPAGSVPTKQWLLNRGYRVEFEGPRSFVAVRADLARLTPPHDPHDWRCFPD